MLVQSSAIKPVPLQFSGGKDDTSLQHGAKALTIQSTLNAEISALSLFPVISTEQLRHEQVRPDNVGI